MTAIHFDSYAPPDSLPLPLVTAVSRRESWSFARNSKNMRLASSFRITTYTSRLIVRLAKMVTCSHAQEITQKFSTVQKRSKLQDALRHRGLYFILLELCLQLFQVFSCRSKDFFDTQVQIWVGAHPSPSTKYFIPSQPQTA